MSRYNYNNLTQIIGDKVQIRDEKNNQAELEICEVNKGALDGSEWESFSVIYSGRQEIHIPQGTYTITHHSFGDIELFLSPNSATEYETVVTRKRTETA